MMMATCLLLVVYFLFLNAIGYLVTTIGFLMLMARLLGSRAIFRDAIFAVIVGATVYAIFNFVLQIGLPSGILG
jgi:hypothetical protein